MTTWSCGYCTLVNPQASPLCEACGSENPALAKIRKSILPKTLTKPISHVKNAIVDIFTTEINRPPRPPYPQNIVTVNDGKFVRVPPPRPPPPLPGSSATSSNIKTSTSMPDVDYSMNWICNKCYKISPLADQKCMICGAVRIENSSTSDGYSSIADYYTLDQHSSSGLCSEITGKVEKDDFDRGEAYYKMIVDHCRATQTIFIDDSFPHSDRSIGDLNRDEQGIVGSVPKEFVWLRPDKIFTKDGLKWMWSVFRDPRSSDIEQGSLGDCWLLSALALIAERPDILDSVVITKEFSPYGVYQIKICVDGIWNVVTVDDFFPCRVNQRCLVFASGRKNQLWVPLIEKAVAKRLGSYSKLTGGRTVEGLALLTGAPCETFSLERTANESEEFLWVKLLSAKEAGFILGCSCGSSSEDINYEEYKSKGLMARHAYSILDLTVEDGHRLIRLRNPWGTFVWNGNWSDNWIGWKPEAKKRLLQEQVSGSFWMSFDDFLMYFDSVDIAKVRYAHPWSVMRVPVHLSGSFDPSDRAIRFVIEKTTEICFSLYRTDGRRAEDRIDLLICVHQITEKGKIGKLLCRSARKLESFVCTGDVFFSPGEYIVICHSLSSLGGVKHPGYLAIHSSVNIYGDFIPCTPQHYRDSLIHLVLKDGQQRSSSSSVLVHVLTHQFAGLILMIDNTIPNMWAHVKTNCTESTNIVSSRGCLLMADSIPPSSRQIVVVLTQLEHTSYYLVSHQIPPIQLSSLPYLGGNALDDTTTHAIHSPHLENATTELLHEATSLFS